MRTSSTLPKALTLWACSDVHLQWEKFMPPEGVDLIVCAGDILNQGGEQETEGAYQWLTQLQQVAPVLLTPGNHDLGLPDRGMLLPEVECILETTVECHGLIFGGAPLSPCFHAPDLATSCCRMTDDPEVDQAYYDKLEPVDILISHCPSAGEIGMCSKYGQVGSPGLRTYIEWHQPQLVICGHIHAPVCRDEVIGEAQVLNIAKLSKTLKLEVPGS